MEVSINTCEWDVIVVGTGMGGGTLGFKLAKAGKRVLFLEKGKSHLRCTATLSGQYAEMFFPSIEPAEPKHAEILRRAGRWTDLIIDASGTEARSQIPFVGSGTGGSSALFGMAMERFSVADFDSGSCRVGAEESSLPDFWPISYADLKPHYEQAEKLYRVRGSVDPLRKEIIETYKSPPPLVASNEELFSFLNAKGFHPYHLPLACDFAPGCQNCQGFLCPKNCRNDSATMCVEPAIQQYGACLLELCEVIRIDTNNDLVSAVVCRWQGKTVKLRSKIVVLAAGALQTPALLLRSSFRAFPNGLANSSGQVGKNLMRHYVDIYAVAVKQKPHATDNLKQLAFNDLRHCHGMRWGTVQSFGTLPPPAMLFARIRKELRNSRLPILSRCFSLFKPIAEMIFSKVFSGKLMLASIMEDLPYIDNAVTLSPTGDVVIKYQIRPNERMRIECFRRRIGDALKPYSFIRIKQAESNSRLAHVCGTCRSGLNPKSSVVDSVNRTHDIGNLFIVDSSFFPSSGGTNPALTIAANALRVADHIITALH
jgi:choline dehydrogenase-like flavoprotein